MSKKDDVRLSWEILAHKYLYYEYADPILTDEEYDILEKMFEEKTGRTADTGFPRNKPSAQFILDAGIGRVKEFLNHNLESRKKQIKNNRKRYIGG